MSRRRAAGHWREPPMRSGTPQPRLPQGMLGWLPGYRTMSPRSSAAASMAPTRPSWSSTGRAEASYQASHVGEGTADIASADESPVGGPVRRSPERRRSRRCATPASVGPSPSWRSRRMRCRSSSRR